MKIYTDASRGNGVIGLGWCVIQDGDVEKHNGYILGEYSSMQAEYQSLVLALHSVKDSDVDTVELLTDCKPLKEKMNSETFDDDGWYQRHRGFERLCRNFSDVELNYIRRKNNKRADRLAEEALNVGRDERDQKVY